MANEFRVKNGIFSPNIGTESGDFTIDSAGDIVIDADGADVILKDDGTEFGRFKRDSSDFVIKSATNNKDIIFKGVDASSTITALTLDMSEAGTALFGHDVTLLNDAAVLGFGADTDVTLTHVADTGLLLNDAMELQFRDSGLKIHSTTNGQLDIDADATVDIASAVTALSGTTGIALVSPSIVLGNTTSASTVVEIKDEVNDANSGELKFVKDKGAAGADGDDIGKITFVGDDAGQTQTNFGQILVEISESANTDEAGKMSFLVAESDGTTTALTAGLVLEGEHATDGEVDVTIAAGTGSTTTVAGNLTVNGNFLPGTDDSHDIGSASAAFQDLFLEGDITLTDAGSIKTSAGDFTVDSAADIILDAAGKDIAFKDDGNTRFRFDLETAPIQTVTGDFTIDCSGTITLDGGGTNQGILFEEGGTEFVKFAKESNDSVSVSAATTTGTNQAGNDIILMGGNATGTGLPGAILFQLHEKDSSSGDTTTSLGTGEATAMSISNGGTVTVGIGNSSPAASTANSTVLDIRGPVGQPGTLTLSTKETTLVDGDKVGEIEFFAPLATFGGDSTALLASITAEADATHSSTVNTTDLVFKTATSTAAAEAMRIKGNTAITTQSDLTVGGNLIVNGTTTTVDTATLAVEDPLIILASGNNSGDTVDIGFYGLYDTSGSQDLYAGLFRDASDSGKFKLFKDLQAAPTTTVDTGGTGYAVATLVANIEGSVTGDITGDVTGSAATVTSATQASITTVANVTTVGALDAGSITSGFGSIDNGTSGIRSNNITAETAFLPDAADGATLGSASLEFSDLYLADGAQILFGNDQDITITHVADTGLRMEDDHQLIFGTGSDLKIYHDGSNSYIDEEGTGSLIINSSQVALKGGADAAENMATFIDNGAVTLYHNNSAKFATTSTGVEVTGLMQATTKSFDIEHPTKKDMRLRYGTLEGPEYGVYHRGISNSRVVDLPDYWTGLVDEDSITVQITPKGQFQSLYVSKIEGNRVYVDSDHGEPLDFYFNVYGERKDVDKLVVEY